MARPIRRRASSIERDAARSKFPASKDGSIFPTSKAAVLIQPAGRTWDYFHEVLLHWGGAARDPRHDRDPGRRLARSWDACGLRQGAPDRRSSASRAFERFSHWLTAVSFVVLGLTGLNITFGKIVLLPLIGPEAFSERLGGGKVCAQLHELRIRGRPHPDRGDFFRDNLFEEGGRRLAQARRRIHQIQTCARRALQPGREARLLASRLPPAVAISASGFLLLFPFSEPISRICSWRRSVHAVVAVLFIALILGHIYIGTLGMEGAFEAMGTGEVDLNWAKEHHDRWLAQQLAGARPAGTAPIGDGSGDSTASWQARQSGARSK